jgi:hypothetical protein
MDLRSQTRVLLCTGVLIALCTGCAHLPSTMLVNAGDQPALFLGSEASSAQIGYLSERVALQITGRTRAGRVPVRIEGALRTRGFVDARALALRVQRRGRVRGTPLYVGPDDVVLVTGSEGKRLRVHAQARLRGQPLGNAFDGSYPREGLGAQPADADAQAPDPGAVYTVPANTAVPLFESPAGAAITELPALPEAYSVTVVNRSENWLAVRAGDGPYLIGWTTAPLVAETVPPITVPTPASDVLNATHGVSLPARLANEPGALKRVAAGTKIVFGEAVIGVLKSEGYARVVQAYEQAGYADVFVAADDDVALRGLVRTVDLSDPPSVSETATPVATR